MMFLHIAIVFAYNQMLTKSVQKFRSSLHLTTASKKNKVSSTQKKKNK